MTEASLYERLGGSFPIAAVVDHFSDAVVRNRPAGERTSVERIQRVNRCVWSLRSARKLRGFPQRRPPPERPGPTSTPPIGQPGALDAPRWQARRRVGLALGQALG